MLKVKGIASPIIFADFFFSLQQIFFQLHRYFFFFLRLFFVPLHFPLVISNILKNCGNNKSYRAWICWQFFSSTFLFVKSTSEATYCTIEMQNQFYIMFARIMGHSSYRHKTLLLQIKMN